MLETIPASRETPQTDGQSIKRLTHIHKHILCIYFIIFNDSHSFGDELNHQWMMLVNCAF